MILVELHPFIDEGLTFDWFASLVSSHEFRPYRNPMLESRFPDGFELKTGLIRVAIRDEVPLPDLAAKLPASALGI
jgi:hypothetical protein